MQPAILYGHGGYLLPRRSEALVGATMESVGFDHTTTPDAQAWLRVIARAVIPSLGLAPVARHWAGLRPMTPDGLPLIGPDPQLDGLWYATGHGRNGILLAVLTGEIIADLLHTGQAPVDAGAFRPDRFHRSGSPHNQPNG
jgi:glycine oxidase